VELRWIDDLQPADATTLHFTTLFAYHPTATAHVLVAERCSSSKAATQTPSGLRRPTFRTTTTSTCRRRCGRGGCWVGATRRWAAHAVGVSIRRAAIGLARSGKLLLSEALAVRGRAAAGRDGTGGGGLHWDEETGKQRLAEVIGRMQGPKEALERVMVPQ
jgi:hypothetical protein